jgi:hypothetical protein
MRGNPGARQPSSAPVYSTINPPRNSLGGRKQPPAPPGSGHEPGHGTLELRECRLA